MANPSKYADLGERLIANSVLQHGELEDHCWVWIGTTTAASYQDYGRINIWQDGKRVKKYAHRVSFEHFKGAIPDKYQVDHLCHLGVCINPSHLQAVPELVNQANRRPRSKRK